MLIYSEYKNTFFFISKINGVIKYMLVFSLLGFCLLHSKSLFCVIKHCLTIVFIYMITWYPLCDVFIHPSNVLLIGHLEISSLILKNRLLMIFLIKLFKISFYSFICQGSTSVVVCMWGQRTTRGCWLLLSTLSFQGWNAGLQVWQQEPLSTESDHQLNKNSACHSVCISGALSWGEVPSNEIFRGENHTLWSLSGVVCLLQHSRFHTGDIRGLHLIPSSF